jgi:hypothetical protein
MEHSRPFYAGTKKEGERRETCMARIGTYFDPLDLTFLFSITFIFLLSYLRLIRPIHVFPLSSFLFGVFDLFGGSHPLLPLSGVRRPLAIPLNIARERILR